MCGVGEALPLRGHLSAALLCLRVIPRQPPPPPAACGQRTGARSHSPPLSAHGSTRRPRERASERAREKIRSRRKKSAFSISLTLARDPVRCARHVATIIKKIGLNFGHVSLSSSSSRRSGGNSCSSTRSSPWIKDGGGGGFLLPNIRSGLRQVCSECGKVDKSGRAVPPFG